MTNEDKLNAFFHNVGEAGSDAMIGAIGRQMPNLDGDKAAQIVAAASVGIAMASFASTGMNRADTLTKVYELAGTMAKDLFNADGTPAVPE